MLAEQLGWKAELQALIEGEGGAPPAAVPDAAPLLTRQWRAHGLSSDADDVGALCVCAGDAGQLSVEWDLRGAAAGGGEYAVACYAGPALEAKRGGQAPAERDAAFWSRAALPAGAAKGAVPLGVPQGAGAGEGEDEGEGGFEVWLEGGPEGKLAAVGPVVVGEDGALRLRSGCPSLPADFAQKLQLGN